MNFLKKNHEHKSENRNSVSKKIKIIALCLLTTLSYAQQKLTKTSQSIKVNKDVIIDLNMSHVEIEIDTWNRDIVEVEAYIESKKLNKEELEKALKVWNLKVDGSNNKVTIFSDGGRTARIYGEGDYTELLRDLEFELAEIPEIPEMPPMPNMAKMPKMPEMPQMPALPELPKGVNTITFDHDKYEKEGEAYLKEWSKKYEKQGGKELQKRMEDWAKRFSESGYQKKMEKWGEEYGKRFEGKWAKDMEKWGEEFGEQFGEDWAKKMEAWGERFGKQMEQRAEAMEKRSEMMAKRTEQREKHSEQRAEHMRKRQESLNNRLHERGDNNAVKKVIKIKIPKKAKLKTNIRHGELKITSVIYDMTGEISHSFLVAEHIDGSNTSINVSYSPVVINTWDIGTLSLNFVDRAQIKSAKNLVLNSKSSNVSVESLSDTAIIDGSFGDLTISNFVDSFKNLNLVLENSDALINLPKNLDYSMYFKGNRSKYNNKPTNQKTIRNYPEGQSSNRTISVNAKFSNLIVN